MYLTTWYFKERCEHVFSIERNYQKSKQKFVCLTASENFNKSSLLENETL